MDLSRAVERVIKGGGSVKEDVNGKTCQSDMTHLEADKEAFWCPLFDEWLDDLGNLVHLDDQRALAGLDLVLGLLLHGMDGKRARDSEQALALWERSWRKSKLTTLV